MGHKKRQERRAQLAAEQDARRQKQAVQQAQVPGLELPRWAVYALILVIPFIYFDALADASSIPRWTLIEVGGPALCAWILARRYLAGQLDRLRLPLVALPVAILVACAFLAAGWAIDGHESIGWAYHYLGASLLGAAAGYVAYHDPERFPIRVMQLTVVAAVGESMIGMAQYFHFPIVDTPGLLHFFQNEVPAATMVHRNALAQYLDTVIAPAFLLVFLARKDGALAAWGAALTLILMMLVATTTRGAWLAAAVAFTLLLVYLLASLRSDAGGGWALLDQFRREPREEGEANPSLCGRCWEAGVQLFAAALMHGPLADKRQALVTRMRTVRGEKIAAIALAFTFAFLIPFWPALANWWSPTVAVPGQRVKYHDAIALEKKLEEFVNQPDSWSGDLRGATYDNTLGLIFDHPFGVGPGNWRVVFPIYKGKRTPTHWFEVGQEPWETHNDTLQITSETGWLGGLAFLSIFVILGWCMHAIASSRDLGTGTRLLAVALFLALLEMWVHSWFSFPFHRPASAMMAWLWIGLLGALTLRYVSGRALELPTNKPVGLALVGLLTLFAGYAAYRHNAHIAADIDLKTADGLMRRSGTAGQQAALRKLIEARNKCEHFLVDRYIAKVAVNLFHGARRTESAEEALRWNQVVLDKDPHFLQALLAAGEISLYLGGKGDDEAMDAAYGYYEHVSELVPRFPHGFQGMGFVEQARGNHGAAIARFREAIARFAEAKKMKQLEAVCYLKLGYSLLLTEKLEEATAQFDRAVALNPAYAAEIAEYLKSQRRVAEGMAFLEKGIAAAPQIESLHQKLGKMLFAQKQHAEAIQVFRRYAQAFPTSALPDIFIGQIQLQTKANAAAAKSFQRSIRLSPTADGYVGLGRAHQGQGNLQAAKTAFRKALEISPDNATAKRYLDLLGG